MQDTVCKTMLHFTDEVQLQVTSYTFQGNPTACFPCNLKLVTVYKKVVRTNFNDFIFDT